MKTQHKVRCLVSLVGVLATHGRAWAEPADRVIAGPMYSEAELTRTLSGLTGLAVQRRLDRRVLGASEAVARATSSTADRGSAPHLPREARDLPAAADPGEPPEESLTGERRIDREALRHAQAAERAEYAPSPRPSVDGSVQFVEGTPVRLRCQWQRMCRITLQEGERYKKTMGTDRSQWLVATAEAGGRAHVTVSPTVPRTEVPVSLAIYTDRRVYDIELVATASAAEHMPRISFYYPEDEQRRWEAEMRREERLEESSAAEAQEAVSPHRPEDFNFSYEIVKEGRWLKRRKIDWAPVLAYDDGEKTYIRMPESMLHRESPVLQIRTEEGTAVLTNYALQGLDFVVPRLFDEAILVKGSGRRQQRVRIARVRED